MLLRVAKLEKKSAIFPSILCAKSLSFALKKTELAQHFSRIVVYKQVEQIKREIG